VLNQLSRAPYQAVPVTDPDGRLLGVVSLEEVHLASQSPNLSPFVVAADLMRGDVTPLQLDDRLDRAQELFVENDLLALPVVDNLTDRRVVGIVKRSDIAGAYLRHVHGGGNRTA
jgi:CBS-domain-containing membrane protein